MAKVKKPTNPVGRPSLYREEYNHKLIEHMSQGLSYETFAATIGVSRETLYEWEKAHPEFSDTKRKALALSQLWWEKAGIEGMLGKGYAAPSMWIYNMRCRFGRQTHQSQTCAWNSDEMKEQEKDNKVDPVKELAALTALALSDKRGK